MKFRGFTGFVVIWIGQFASLFGSGLTRFALTIWIFKQTSSPTALTMTAFFGTLPMLALGPLGGALADRWDRKKVMILSDTLAGVATLSLLLVYLSGELALWHLFIAVFLSGVADTFQLPAFMGSITMMLPEKHYGRANGMRELAATASSIFAPIAAAALLAFIDLQEIFYIDLLTFGIAIFTIGITFIPQPEQTEIGETAKGNLWQDMVYGFKFILERPSLRSLQSLWMTTNLFGTMSNVLLAALVLARTNNDELVLGSIQAILSGGAVAGGLIISVWGGPKRKIPGVLLFLALGSLLGRVLFAFGRDFYSWIPGAFFMFFFVPLLNGTLASIWQTKVPPDVQGRVMSARITASRAMIPLGTLIAGPLAEQLFEPAMMPGGQLTSIFSGVVGIGPGAGMSVIILLTGLIMFALAPIGYAVPAIRNAEALLPTFNAQPKSEAQGS
jgi:MFS family permease